MRDDSIANEHTDGGSDGSTDSCAFSCTYPSAYCHADDCAYPSPLRRRHTLLLVRC